MSDKQQAAHKRICEGAPAKKLKDWGTRIAMMKHEMFQDGLMEAARAMSTVEDAYMAAYERLAEKRPELLTESGRRYRTRKDGA